MSSAPAPVLVVHSASRAVRFDDQCALIPECSSPRGRRTKVVTYSLPLWKRRRTSATLVSDSECTDDAAGPTTAAFPSSPEDTHVVLRVPIPSFLRSTNSTTRSPSTSPTIPLSPCLVSRSPSSPISTSLPTQRPSLPIYHRRPDDQTVPLRPCCPDCVPITEESLKEGSTLKECFTRGARRRRSASLDSNSTGIGSIIMSSSSTLIPSSSSSSKMSSILTPSSTLGESLDEPLPTFTLTVDEVDKRRRKSQEGFNSSRSRFDLTDRHSSLSTDPTGTTSPQHISIPPKSSPIAEEDESELFPLPSPRRSPSSSPNSSSPNKTSPRVSPKPSPAPSPNNSNSCLHPSSAAVAFPTVSSKEGPSADLSLELEEKLGSSVGILRKDRVGVSESGASTPKLEKPSLTLVSSSTGSSSDDTASNSPTSPSTTSTTNLTSSSSTSLSSRSSPRQMKSSPRLPTTNTTRSFSSTSLSLNSSKQHVPSSSASHHHNARIGSFTLPFLKAGEAVLKGVSSISGSGIGAGAGAV